MAAAKKKAKKVEPKRDRTPKGQNSRGARKFTDDQVIGIYTRYKAGGITYKSLAEEFGVTSTAIGAIIRGESYVWLIRKHLAEQKCPAELAEAA